MIMLEIFLDMASGLLYHGTIMKMNYNTFEQGIQE